MELTEVIFVLAILLVVFGPKKLPELARQLGEAVREFRRASSGMPSLAVRDTTDMRTAIEEIAKELGIETEGKAIKEITREIMRKIESKTLEK